MVIAGVMSGTSLDGLDIALCEFSQVHGQYKFRLICAETIEYSDEMKNLLATAQFLPGKDLIRLNNLYGEYIGTTVHDFLNKHYLKAEYISSHGHTIFHDPISKTSLQVGNGAYICSSSGISVVSDFRTLDISLGGQGAPLVPIGDKLLFGDFSSCLNLGGFSNISYEQDNQRIAYDICPVNFILNALAIKEGAEYDFNGNFGKQGNVDKALLSCLNELPFYSMSPPKSLGREWVEKQIFPLIENATCSNFDKLRTVYEHIALQISGDLNKLAMGNVLLTGGGAKNAFLINLLREKTKNQILIPDDNLVDFKEAIIFGFLGYLRISGVNNCLSSVTGAIKDNCGGVIHLATK